MAKRYCGRYVVNVVFVDKYAEYACTIYHDVYSGKKHGHHLIYVHPPASSRIAVDSPQAYDDAAHAALSFATSPDQWNMESELDYTDSGFRIRRKK